jgi:hypothetical protein
VISLWSANSGIKALFDALNAVYKEKEKRSFSKLNAVTLSFTIGITGFLLIALACVVALPVVLNYIPAAGMAGLLLNLARWPILFVLVAWAYFDLPVRPEPDRTAMAIYHLGECICGDPVARGLRAVLMVCSQFWELQQNLWLARRHHGVHDVDVAVDNCRSGGRQAQCGSRASDDGRSEDGRHDRPS